MSKINFKNIITYLILAVAVGFNLYFLWPELRILADLNDNVFAFGLINRANDIVKNCSLINPDCFIKLLDHWVSYWAMGYPLPHFYQHWPTILVVVLTKIFSPLTGASLFEIFNLVKYLLYAAFPLAVYYSARKFDLPPLAAAFSAFLGNLISTNFQYGTDYGAVIWRGSGMHTQLWGMITLPLAVSSIYTALKDLNRLNLSDLRNLGYLGDLVRRLVPAILFLTLSFHAHLLFGYIAILSTLFLPFLFAFRNLILSKNLRPLSNLGNLILNTKYLILNSVPYLGSLFLIYFLTFILLSYWLIPLMLNNDLHAQSVWDDYWKFNSFGTRTVIERWVSGEIFDFNRFPAMTILVIIGFFGSLLSFLSHSSHLSNLGNLGDLDVLRPKTKDQRLTAYIFFPLLLVFWTLMYFGRNTWGGLIDLLPMSEGIHMHRFINGIHFAGIFLAGFGLYWLSSSLTSIISLISLKIPKPPNQLINVIKIIIVIIIIVSPLRERVDFLNYNAYLVNHANNAFLTDMKDFQPILDKLAVLQKEKPGRVWAGRPGNWGREFKVGMVSVFLTMSVRGFDTLGFEPESWSPNTDMEQFFDENRLDHYNLFNIRYVIAPSSQKVPDFAKKELASGKYVLYTVDTNGNFDAISTPYLLKTDKEAVLNFVHSWLWSKFPTANNHFLISYGRPPVNVPSSNLSDLGNLTTLTSLDWSNYRALDKDYNLLTYNPFDATPSSVPKVKFSNEKVSLNNFSVTVDTPQETLVMLKATYHPFWQAKIKSLTTNDQRLTTKYMVSPAFMAVKVPKGKSEISFTYKIEGYKKFLIALSFLTLITLLLLSISKLKLPRLLK